MSRRTVAFVVIALAASLGFVRLGFWQLSRLGERRARNAEVIARMSAAPVPVANAMRDADSARYRPVVATGRFDYERELVYVARSRSGSPGVYLATPLRTVGSDSAVLVLRGWVYSPDGRTVDLTRWREGDNVSVSGYVDDFGPAAGPVSLAGEPRAVRHLVLDSVRARLPYPVLPQLVVQTSDSAERADRPARLTLPVLDDGPHLSYAIQWFAFTLIAWVGVAVVVRRELSRRKPET